MTIETLFLAILDRRLSIVLMSPIAAYPVCYVTT